MTRGLRIMVAALVFAAAAASGQEDPGKAAVGRVMVTVYHGTDGDAKSAGARFAEVPKEIEARLRKDTRLRFSHYRLLGQDTQPLLRSYENWAQPLKPSDEVLVRFEARSRPTDQSMRLDLELWLSRKKILKTDALLEGGRPLFVLGPPVARREIDHFRRACAEGKTELIVAA